MRKWRPEVASGEAHSVREFVAAAFDRVGISGWEGLVDVDPASSGLGAGPSRDALLATMPPNARLVPRTTDAQLG